MSYVLACVIQFNQGAKEVRIVARGRAISKAVDVAEIVRQRFLPEGVKLGKITTGTEIMGATAEDKRNVSTIEIQLLKA
jgi:DNA-binding protein